MKNEFLPIMLELVEESGKVALELIQDSSPALKPDNSVITDADKAVSKLARSRLDQLLKTSEHILIDEEDAGNAKYLDQSFLENTPYIWALDPIDGTRLYANRLPFFGISLGLIKDLKPYLGVVYFPGIHELFYCDGEQSYFVQNAFSGNQKKHRIQPIDHEIISQSIFYCHDSFFEQFQWDNSQCRAMILACAVVDMCWPAIGRGCGACLKPAIWDCAGSWPIIQSAGLQMRGLNSGKVLSEVSVESFKKEGSPWELKELHIMSSEKNYDVIKGNMKPLQ